MIGSAIAHNVETQRRVGYLDSDIHDPRRFLEDVLAHPAFGAGSSGAGFGMIAVILALLYRRAGSWEAFISNPAAKTMLVNTGIWVLIGFSGAIRMDNYAHLGGFAFGIPCGLLLETRRGRSRGRWIAGLAAYIFVWLGVVVAACIPGLGFGG